MGTAETVYFLIRTDRGDKKTETEFVLYPWKKAEIIASVERRKDFIRWVAK